MFGGFDPFESINSMMRQQMQDMEMLMSGRGMFGPQGMIPPMFGQRFHNPRQQMIEDDVSRGQQQHNRHRRSNNALMEPLRGDNMLGGGLFGFGSGLMGNMFQQMEALKERAANDPNALVYSESKVLSMAPDQNGRLQTYESSDSLRKHGAVKETRSTVRDSSRGVEQMAIGHHIGGRGHVIEKKRVNGGNIEENQQFLNIRKNEAQKFDDEWASATRSTVMGDRYGLHDDRQNTYLPIEGRRGERDRHASPYSRSNNRKKNRGPIIEEAD